MVYSLIEAYGLLNHMSLRPHGTADDNSLKQVHTSDYVEHLKQFRIESNMNQVRQISSDHDDSNSDLSICGDDEEYGLGYDCPTFSGLYEYVGLVAGATLKAVEAIIKPTNKNDVAINWFGGWHHAQTDRASGFCYVNDIGLAIQKLRNFYDRILYIDLDVHHGDGVQNIFSASKKVLTLSFHLHESGFFPTTGGVDEQGFGDGKDYLINAPYKFNIGSKFVSYFKEIFETTVVSFRPNVFVVQCGADVLAGDPLGGANLTIEDCEACISCILEKRGPKLFLGGGGYFFPNTSRYWTRLTALILGETLDDDIPEHEHFEKYGPDFTVNVDRKALNNRNTSDYLLGNVEKIRERLGRIKKNLDEQMLRENLSKCAK